MKWSADLKMLFAPVGKREKRVGKDFIFYCNKMMRAPGWAPMILKPGVKLKRSHLKGIEKFFRVVPPFSPQYTKEPPVMLDNRYPYISLIKGETPKNDLVLKEHGWKRYETLLTVNIWRKVVPLELPEGYSFAVGNFFDKSLLNDHVKMIVDVFGFNKKTSGYIIRCNHFFPKENYIVNIYDPRKKIAASASVIAKDGIGFLYSGSVMPKHRKKGLWKALVSLRQMVSRQHKVHTWVLTTTTDHLRRNCDESFDLITYLKH